MNNAIKSRSESYKIQKENSKKQSKSSICNKMRKLRKVCEVMTEHLKIKHRMKEDIKTYSDMMKSPLLSDEEKKMLNLIYIEKQDYRYIGDLLGISESTVKKRHKDLLNKIGKILQAGL